MSHIITANPTAEDQMFSSCLTYIKSKKKSADLLIIFTITYTRLRNFKEASKNVDETHYFTTV